MAVINGRQYEFADLTLILGGRDIVGFRGITYKESQEKEPLYGKGNKPVSIQKGNIKYEGNITLLQSELETLIAAGGGSILGLSMNAVVCYGNPSEGDMTTDRIVGLQFTEQEKGLKQADKNAEISLPFICLDIEYQV